MRHIVIFLRCLLLFLVESPTSHKAPAVDLNPDVGRVAYGGRRIRMLSAPEGGLGLQAP